MKILLKIISLLCFGLLLTAFEKEESKPRIFLIGDSTMADKRADTYPETGWGMIFPRYIDAQVFNYAVNGRSTRSFRTLGNWSKVNEQLKAGDWVFIQFGHNDSKESDTSRYAAAQTDYRKNLNRYITEIKSKGAKPLLITPVMRRKFDEQGNFIDQHGDYPIVVRDIAKEQHIPLIDLHAMSKDVIVQHGVEDSKVMFLNLPEKTFAYYSEGKDDNTHFTPYGAGVVASLVAKAIVDLKIELSMFIKPSVFSGKNQYELPKIMSVEFRKDTFNILSYGAKCDGVFLNTAAINAAIDECNKNGGGTVIIPKGFWLSGPLTLKSNVNLHIAKGAVLQFSNQPGDYALIKTNWEGLDSYRAQSPMYANGVDNIGITGGGIVDGAGEAWRPVKKNKLTLPEWIHLIESGGVLNESKDTWFPTDRALKGSKEKRPGVIAEGYDLERAETIKEFLRPNMISLVNCKRVLIDGVTFQNSPAWCLHPLLSRHLTIKNVTVRNPWNAQNGDGIDLESCSNVLLENSNFDVGDDGICIKSGRDEEGRKRNAPTQDVIIRNCNVFHAHGGFVVGSEMSGGARNIYVSDCNFLGTDIGLRFKTTRGRGGVVEKIYVNNINMSNIGGAAILFDMYYMAKDPLAMFSADDSPAIEMKPVTEGTPQFRDIHIKDVTCKGAETAIFIRGLPEMNINSVTMENIFIQSEKGFICTEAENISLLNALLYCDEKAVIQMFNSRNITIDQLKYKATDLLIKIEGDRSKSIRLLNTDVSLAKQESELGVGVSKNVIIKKNK